VAVDVAVGVVVLVGVDVNVLVAVGEGVMVGVDVGVKEGVTVGVLLGVEVAVSVTTGTMSMETVLSSRSSRIHPPSNARSAVCFCPGAIRSQKYP